MENNGVGETVTERRSASLRPRSCGSAELPVSPTMSSSSSNSSTSTLTSAGGSGTDGTPPLWKTLVRPRPWRFVQRSRMGGSLDRERAREEDTSLDGDVKPVEEVSLASLDDEEDEDVFPKKASEPPSSVQTDGVDPVTRTKSESDIAVRKAGGERLTGFKTRAERFSLKTDQADQPAKADSVSFRSHTLPHPHRARAPLSQLSTSTTAASTPLDPSMIKFNSMRRSRSSCRPAAADAAPKTVTFREPEKQDSTPSSPEKTPDPCAVKADDSPSRSISMDVQESVVKVSFSKPPPAPPPVRTITLEKPADKGGSNQPPATPERPDVPAKPARLRLSSSGDESKRTSPVSPSSSAAPEKPRRHSSSALSSPRSPTEDVLISMGFKVVEDGKSAANKPKLTVKENGSSRDMPPKTDKTEPRASRHGPQAESPDVSAPEDSKPVSTPTTQSHTVPPLREPAHATANDSKPAKTKEREIVPKKMMKIKGDKKAEEKAAKAKKKELKAKEKELQKSKSKSSTDSTDHDRGRVKLFPWRVEFHAKDKPSSADPPSKTKETKKKKETKKAKQADKAPIATPAALPPVDKPDGVHQVLKAHIAPVVDAAQVPTKRQDKEDGSGNSSNNDSSSSNSKSGQTPLDTPSPETPPEPEQQQQQQQDGLPETQDPLRHRQPSPSSSLSPSPQPLPAPPSSQQPHHHHQQQLPPRQSTPRPRYVDEMSSSDQNSDIDSLYGSLRRNQHQQGRAVRIYESDGEITPQGTLDRPGRRVAPRRHTVGGAQIKEHMQLMEDTDRKREAFYAMLASRYPQYAEKITGMGDYPAERNSRSREPQRRRTTTPTPYGGRHLDYEDPGTMSDIEPSSFQRGGYARASMPIVRSASTSLERPIGLVFLVFRDETKKALLPNEITSLDTVRALFVRAFPEKLSMEFLDSPKRKIYILANETSIFFQLEDLRDIQDRTVLKIHECDSDEHQQVKSQPEVRGRATHRPAAAQVPRPSSRQGFVGEAGPHFRDEMAKAQSLPVAAAHNYQDMLQKERAQWEMEQEYLQQRRSRSRSQTPEPAERPRSLSTGRYSHSPDRLPTPDRNPPHLNPIPENPRLLANGFRQAALNGGHYETLPGNPAYQHHPTGHPHPPPPGRVLSPPPVGQPVYESVYQAGVYNPNQPTYVSHSMRAGPQQVPQRASGPPPGSSGRGGPQQRNSLPFAAMSNPIYESFPQRTQSYRVTPERDVLPARPQSAAPPEMSRMERMEAQIATLTAWVHQVQTSPTEPPPRRGSSRSTSSGHSESTDTYPGSSASSLSDIPAAYSLRQPTVTSDMKEKMNDIQCRLREFRVELQGLRRMEQLNQEAMRDAFGEAMSKVKRVIGGVPGAENQVVRHQRMEVTTLADTYMQDKTRVEKELSDLESSVEELKEDVLARKCRISVSDVEGFALVLSNITKSLADLKARFPQVRESLKKVMAGEMEIVVKEEKFVKEEPLQIEAALKRCKQLTNTLYTLKRLATVQDTRPPQVPLMAQESKEVGEEEKMAILESIRAMVPDHETRVHSLEAADASRERKKKMVTQHESLKFTKSLQAASKSLKAPEPQMATAPTKPMTDSTPHSRTEPGKSTGKPVDSRSPPMIPAKPARLLLPSEMKSECGAASPGVQASAPPSLPSHTVTVTSQISDEGDGKTEAVPAHASAARSAFFSSMQPATSSSTSAVSKHGAGVSSSAAPSSMSPPSPSSPSHSKPPSGVYYQAVSPSRSRSAFSSIPLPNKEQKEEAASKDKGRKVPPPPPPRKSSAKFPYGIGPLSPQSSSVNGGGTGGPVRRSSTDRSPDTRRKDAVLTVYKANSPTSPLPPTPISSSTPKPATPQKPVVSKADQKQQRMTTFAAPAPAAVTTNSIAPDDGDLSGSESTGSTTSLDSQQGAPLLRSNSSASTHRGPRPNPPQRHSSLLASRMSEELSHRTKTQMLQDRAKRSQDSSGGSGSTQVNGLNGAKHGHKT